MAISRVWIEEGCSACGLCVDTCPEVFEMNEGDEAARVIEGADLAANDEQIRQAADDCPESVIAFEET